MPWICLSDDELKTVYHALDVLRDEAGDNDATKLREHIQKVTSHSSDDAYYMEGAEYVMSAHGMNDPHELEGWPDHPFVSESDDGAYVMAWIWVDKPDDEEEDDDDAGQD